MTKKTKKGPSLSLVVLIIVAFLVDFALLLTFLLQGTNIALFNPKGFIANEQYSLMMYNVAVLLAVMVPTIILLFFIAWKYQDSRASQAHSLKPRQKKFLVLSMWTIPTLVMLLLARTMIPATHDLAPQKSIASTEKPITIQVVSLRWKWLFIYPEQGIATVNFVQVPVDTPIEFELTADEAPMSSFWVPNLGGQLYTMTGMVNRLNIMADTVGDYPGSSAEINGKGFAGMKFTARASSESTFDQWVRVVKQSPDILDASAYDDLVEPSENNPPAFFSAFDEDLYAKVIMKYTGSSEEGETHH